ncbi:MAG: porin family protein, partial [Methylocystaceae bacterium]|nr:porin family protein [Methylocystaceae bacterium]
MKTKIASASALILLSSIGSALAADLPTKKAPPVAAPAPLWKGLYVGLNAGGIWGNNSSIDVSDYPAGAYANSNPTYWAGGNGAVSSQSNNLAGFIGGGQVG